MKSVFIINKNPELVSELRSIIDWENYDYKIISADDNGTSAMSFIMRKQPELVFLENDLPGLTGLEIIERIREHGIFTEFILIEKTGDFELARKAMRLGVREYLVTPVSTDDLIRVLEHNNEVYQANHSKEVETSLFSTRRLLRNSFMRNFVSSDDHQEFSISELNKYYHFTFKDGIFQVALIQLRNLPKEEESSFLPSVVEELRMIFDPISHEMIPFIQGSARLTLLFNYNSENNIPQHFEEIRNVIKNALIERSCIYTSYSIGISNKTGDVNSLLDILHAAERAAYCGTLRGANQLYYFDNLVFDNVKKEDVITPSFLHELEIGVESMDFTRYENAIRNAFKPVTAHTDPEIIVEICRQAILEVAKSCGDADAITREEVRNVLYMVMNAASLSTIISSLVENARNKLELAQKEREFTRPVREATRYIKNNFTKNITLANVADYVHLNSSYLSMLFKKETGQNYMEFLTDCRINEAKRMLKDSSMSVAEICYAVGYTDKKHFSRLFIKQVGVKPTSYRSLH